MNWSLLLEIFGFTVGIIYLWYEYHANAKVWIASVVMPLISMWIYFRKGLYADFAINIYYVAIAVYGYLAWTFRNRKAAAPNHTGNSDRSDLSDSSDQSDQSDQSDSSGQSPLTVSHIPALTGAGCAAAALLLWGGIYLLLSRLTDSTVPVADAFTTALSIVALWMMARKYAEQWLVWLVVDAVCVALYIYKGIYFYAALYAIYTVIAWLGYRKWLSLIPTHP